MICLRRVFTFFLCVLVYCEDCFFSYSSNLSSHFIDDTTEISHHIDGVVANNDHKSIANICSCVYDHLISYDRHISDFLYEYYFYIVSVIFIAIIICSVLFVYYRMQHSLQANI